MTGEVIKSFLVGLGFGVDDASLAKFNQAIASATLKVTALYGSIKVAAAGIGFGLSEISEGFEKMGYEYRIIAPAINKALALRRELLKAYSAAGINITKVIQQSVKLNFSIAKTKFAFEALYKSVASRFFGLLTQQSDNFRRKLYENLPKIQNVLENVIKFIFKLYEATVALGSRLSSIAGHVYEFLVKLDKATDGWSTRILAAIAAWKLLNLSFLATPFGLVIAGLTTLLALWDDFKTFKEGGQALINWGSETTRTVVGLTAVLLALSAAIISIAKVYSLWTNATKIQAVAQAALNLVMSLNPIGAVLAGVSALIVGLTYLDNKFKIFGGTLSAFFSGVGGKILDVVSQGGNKALGVAGSDTGVKVANVASQNLEKALNTINGPKGDNLVNNITNINPRTGAPQAQPLGSNVTQNAQNNQNVQQQTNINVIGSADAQSVGKAVSSEQGKVNFDLVRNLKGATR